MKYGIARAGARTICFAAGALALTVSAGASAAWGLRFQVRLSDSDPWSSSVVVTSAPQIVKFRFGAYFDPSTTITVSEGNGLAAALNRFTGQNQFTGMLAGDVITNPAVRTISNGDSAVVVVSGNKIGGTGITSFGSQLFLGALPSPPETYKEVYNGIITVNAKWGHVLTFKSSSFGTASTAGLTFYTYASPTNKLSAAPDAANGPRVDQEATIQVIADPLCVIVDPPQLVTSLPAGVAKIAVQSAWTNATFQWRRDGSALSDGGRLSGTKSAELTISGVQSGDQGAYDCLILTPCGTATTQPAQFSCKPVLTIQPPAFQTPRTGQQLTVDVPAGTNYTFRWRQNQQNLFNVPGLLSGVTTRTLTLLSNDPSLRGVYDCVVTDACGSTTSAQSSLCSGDLNGDRLVDDADFGIFCVLYDWQICERPEMPPGCTADLNGDGFVNDADFSVFVVAYEALLCQ